MDAFDEFSVTQHILDAGEAAFRRGRKLARVRCGFLRWVDLHREMRTPARYPEKFHPLDRALICQTVAGPVSVILDESVDLEFLCAEED